MTATAPSTRTIAKIFFTVVLLAAAVYALYLVRQVVGLVFISVFVAVALGPAVDRLNRRGVPRSGSILLVYLLLVLAIVGIGLLLVPPVVTQVQKLANKAPHYVQDLRKNKIVRKYDNRYHITAKLKQQADKLPSRLASAAGALKDVTVGVFSALVQLVTVLTMAFFLLLDGKRLTNFVFGLVSPAYEQRARKVAGDIYRAVSGYVAGNLLISAVAGTTAFITLAVLGVSFAVPLAIFMAFMDLIPLVGATIGGVVIGIVTAFHSFPFATIVWAIVFVVYQQIENNVLQPVVYRKTVDVAPLLVLIAVLIGASLLGVLGALVAIPVAAAIQIVVRDWWEYRRRQAAATEPGPGHATVIDPESVESSPLIAGPREPPPDSPLDT